MAVFFLENPVLFGMRLGAELDQIRQSAMQQAIAQSLATAREQLQFAWGMLGEHLRYVSNLPEQQKAAWEPILRSLSRALMPPSGPQIVRGATYVPYLRPAGLATTLGGVLQEATAQQNEQSAAQFPTTQSSTTLPMEGRSDVLLPMEPLEKQWNSPVFEPMQQANTESVGREEPEYYNYLLAPWEIAQRWRSK